MRETLIETLKYCASPEADCAKCDRWSLEIDSKCVEDLLLSAAIALEEKQATSDENKRWIPVSERLPNGNEICLVLTIVGHCVVAYHNNVLWRVLWNSDRLDNDEVTHWMPLPEAPNGERRTDV